MGSLFFFSFWEMAYPKSRTKSDRKSVDAMIKGCEQVMFSLKAEKRGQVFSGSDAKDLKLKLNKRNQLSI